MYSSNCSEYQTPRWLYKNLDEEFHFEFDPCTTSQNPLGTKFYCTKYGGEDGLEMDWNVPTFVNPPYGREVYNWVKKAWVDSRRYGNPIVMLLPSRTDTKWFHDYIYKKPLVEIRFLKGRIKFENTKTNAPFPSMVVIFR